MEPSFFDDETLVSNLDEASASRVISWLSQVNKQTPKDLSQALYLVHIINNLFGAKTEDEKTLCLIELDERRLANFCSNEIHDQNILERIMRALEEKYVS